AFEEQDIPADLLDRAEELRSELVEAVASTDDDLLERYLGDEELGLDELKRAIRAATISNEIVPVFTGSAFKNKGVQPLLDAVIDYMPAPTDLPPVEGYEMKGGEPADRGPDPKEPFSALAFKIVTDPHGKLTYF